LFKILQDVNSCSEDLRWSSQFCASHAKIESCLKRAFEKCFNNGSAQKLVRGEKVRLRRKIEEEWGNRIQVDELEKLFDGCAYIAPCPPPGLLLNQKLHWLDHVRTDGDCDYAEKAEVKKWLSFEAPLLDSSTLPKCLSESEATYVLEELGRNVNKKNNRRRKPITKETQVSNPSPRTSGSSSGETNNKALLLLLLIILI